MRNATISTKAEYARAAVDYVTKRKEITLSVSDDSAVASLEELKGKLLAVEIKPWKDKRSLDANAYLWALLDKIAQAIRSSKDEIYLQELEKYGVCTFLIVRPESAERITREWRTVRNLGEVTVNGQNGVQLQCFYGSSGYDTAEMARLLDGVIEDAKELGIQTETPDEIAKMKASWGV